MAHRPPTSDVGDFKRLFIFGAGGSGREVAWLASQVWREGVEIIHVVDREEYLSPPNVMHPVVLLSEVVTSPEDAYVVALGASDGRRSASAACELAGMRPTVILHPRVEFSITAHFGKGSIVCAGCIVTTEVLIGRHVHLNLGCTVSHDVRIGDFATLSPGVHVSGHVAIESDVFIGTGANIINGRADAPLVIGAGATIAAGACVTKSVEPGALMAGVPAARKR